MGWLLVVVAVCVLTTDDFIDIFSTVFVVVGVARHTLVV
jgi:hypothetical protein